jgi:putative endonuclease
MAAKDVLGRDGEAIAVRHLEGKGYRIIDRNWRCAQGEIDIVARQNDETVFVEVKTRSSIAYGHPFEAITTQKLARLRRLAGAWCLTTSTAPRHIRIDVVSVIVGRAQEPAIEHIEAVF